MQVRTDLEDEQKAHSDECKSKDTGEPVSAWLAGPANDEKPDGESDRSKHHRRQAHFRLGFSIFGVLESSAEDSITVGNVYG